MNIKKIIILGCVLPLLAFNIHKLHMSLTKIVHNKDKQLQVTMRFFIDDIEKDINTKYHIVSELGTDREFKKIDSIYTLYLKNTFELQINNSDITLNFIGKEYDQDLVYFYLESKKIETINSINITNKVLFDLFSDQQNITKTTINNKKKTLFLTQKNPIEKIKF